MTDNCWSAFIGNVINGTLVECTSTAKNCERWCNLVREAEENHDRDVLSEDKTTGLTDGYVYRYHVSAIKVSAGCFRSNFMIFSWTFHGLFLNIPACFTSFNVSFSYKWWILCELLFSGPMLAPYPLSTWQEWTVYWDFQSHVGFCSIFLVYVCSHFIIPHPKF